jgi:cytochrome c556
MTVRSLAVVTLTLALTVTGTAVAVTVDDAIKYRKSVYQVIKWNFGPMGAMVKGEMPFDAEAFARHAERVAALSGMPLEGFIPDSDLGDTTAKSEIWQQWDTFKSRMQDFETEAAKLAEVARGGDEKAIRAQFGATAKTCKACHDDFRMEL